MEIGTSTLYNIGSNYSVKLNSEEVLVYEEDTLRKRESFDEKKLEKERDKKENLEKLKSVDKLSEDEKRLVNDLKSRDSEVRVHEAAHQGAGGGMTGAASFTYQQGPDGRMYAIGGEVSISVPSGSTPQESIQNAKQAIAAAMAPSDPSGQDFAVASSAMVMLMKAEQQLAKESQEEMLGKEAYSNLDEKKSSTTSKDSANSVDISA